jgi:hypothetical protein
VKPREYVDGYLTTTETLTDYVLIYVDGPTAALDYVPIMGPGDVLVRRERLVRTTFGAWEVAREGASIESLNPTAPLHVAG